MKPDLQTEAQSRGCVQRSVRPGPRTFQHFPEEMTCPICGTNDDGESVLVEIAGTAEDRIAEAKPMHLACAVARKWYDEIQTGVIWPNAPDQRPGATKV